MRLFGATYTGVFVPAVMASTSVLAIDDGVVKGPVEAESAPLVPQYVVDLAYNAAERFIRAEVRAWLWAVLPPAPRLALAPDARERPAFF